MSHTTLALWALLLLSVWAALIWLYRHPGTTTRLLHPRTPRGGAQTNSSPTYGTHPSPQAPPSVVARLEAIEQALAALEASTLPRSVRQANHGLCGVMHPALPYARCNLGAGHPHNHWATTPSGGTITWGSPLCPARQDGLPCERPHGHTGRHQTRIPATPHTPAPLATTLPTGPSRCPDTPGHYPTREGACTMLCTPAPSTPAGPRTPRSTRAGALTASGVTEVPSGPITTHDPGTTHSPLVMADGTPTPRCPDCLQAHGDVHTDTCTYAWAPPIPGSAVRRTAPPDTA